MKKADQTLKICKNCGAEYAYKEPACPYCGTVNEIGAREQYMNKLRHIKSDMQDLEDIASDSYKEELKKTGRTAGKTVAIILLILAVIGGAVFACWLFYERVYLPKTMKAQLLWEQQVFPQLDEWYEHQEFDKIQTFQAQMYKHKETKKYSIYRWEHSWFMEYYDRYTYLHDFAKTLEQGGTIPEESKGLMLCDSLYLIYFEEMLSISGVAKIENRDYLEEYASFAEDFLNVYMGIDPEQISSIYEQVIDPEFGFISYTQCEEYAQTIK